MKCEVGTTWINPKSNKKHETKYSNSYFRKPRLCNLISENFRKAKENNVTPFRVHEDKHKVDRTRSTLRYSLLFQNNS